jgi:large subunit ribosomal protein L22
MQAAATIKYIRTSPKKLRELAKAARGLSPNQAIDRLNLQGTKAGKLLAKAIISARNNATNNSRLSSALLIKTIEIGKGPTFKRFRPVSRGMAHEIKKRTAHIRVTVEEVLVNGQPVRAEQVAQTVVSQEAPKLEEAQIVQQADATMETVAEEPKAKKTAKKAAKKAKAAKK